MQLSRPDKLRATRTGGYTDVEIVFDGKMPTVTARTGISTPRSILPVRSTNWSACCGINIRSQHPAAIFSCFGPSMK
jgi:hypothetical protein